jgi:hypothetical protein
MAFILREGLGKLNDDVAHGAVLCLHDGPDLEKF